MKHLALSFALALLFICSFTTFAQDRKASSDDSAAVTATVKDYIEAYYAGDAARMERTLHPHYLKHIIHGEIPV